MLVDAAGCLVLANSQAADFFNIAPDLLQSGTPISRLGPLMARTAHAQLDAAPWMEAVDLLTISEVQRVLTPEKGTNPSAGSGIMPSEK